MTFVFDMQIHKVMILGEMHEWRERFPLGSKNRKNAMAELSAWRSGDRPNNAEYMPKIIVMDRPRKSWPDVFTTNNGLHVISDRGREMLETLDPGVHQFFPLTLQTKRGLEIEGPWFAMTVHVKQDSIVMEKSLYSESKNWTCRGIVPLL